MFVFSPANKSFFIVLRDITLHKWRKKAYLVGLHLEALNYVQPIKKKKTKIVTNHISII